MDDIVGIILRSLHIVSAVVLVGAAFYIKFSGGNPPSMRFVVTPSVLLVASGLWQMMQAVAAGVPSRWHMIFGIKFLLALHVIAVMVICALPKTNEGKRRRLAFGATVSGSVIVALAVAMTALRQGN
ncbi:MAG: hypothetical protein NTV70_09545 [Acidobacteria bacterium]|nr:hypothetical protein [Acidobacteriota bacterium]